jgi:elongation factor 1 alpha-like protein
MSRHQYIRNLDYGEAVDEYDGYSEEEDELSPEDRALMNQGTADVQAALGVEVSKVTVAQIEEALWHYYYDVDKSVAYLISKFVNPRPKATKPAVQPPNGKSVTRAIDTAAAGLPLELGIPSHWAAKYLDLTDAGLSAMQAYSPNLVPWRQTTEYPSNTRGPSPSTTMSFEHRTSTSHFFQDMPWGNIPKHRETTFIAPQMPRGGLLGGSGAPPKMSKLQALAAARKKKAEEKKAIDEKAEQTRMQVEDLSMEHTPVGKENMPMTGPSSKRPRTSEFTAQGVVPVLGSKPTQPEASHQPGVVMEMADDESPPGQGLSGSQPGLSKTKAPEDERAAIMAEPSAFAQLLCWNPSTSHPPNDTESDPFYGFGCGYGADNKGNPPKKASAPTDWFEVRKRRRDDPDNYEEEVILYPNLPQSVRDTFAQPSPDDVVLAAQAKAKSMKGSLLKSTR